MPLLTLFSAPKPFTDPHIAVIQRNAIQSWLRLPDVEVILLGDEAGLAQVAAEFGVKHLPEVACNPSGTPLISS
ncbi:MAG: glycosyl transferase family 2, partial [Candidatus Villigracilaceae bacterium]